MWPQCWWHDRLHGWSCSDIWVHFRVSEVEFMHTYYHVSLWLTIHIHMVWIIKYFFVPLAFPVAGMMDLLQQFLCHTFATRSVIKTFALIQDSSELELQKNYCWTNKLESSQTSCPNFQILTRFKWNCLCFFTSRKWKRYKSSARQFS